jgi:hypothetical protein
VETSRAETISSRNTSGTDSKTSLQSHRAVERKARPVFVMGCHRSGTNLLYDTLLSAGGFAVYRGYLPIYKMLVPRFGGFARLANRKKAMGAWVRSKGFRRAGLDAEQLTTRVLAECHTGGDFIRIVMSELASRQRATRWAVYDPDNLLYIANIEADIPEALFIHIIRDGRDVALSLSKMGGLKPLPWNRQAQGLLASALYWEWMVRRGRGYGHGIPENYVEVRYEDLVSEPRATLRTIGEFLDHDLDYDRIQRASLGRLREPNSSFSEGNDFDPVNRWRNKLSSHELASIEATVGAYLGELGYPLSSAMPRRPDFREACMRSFYFNLLEAKLWLKTRTPLGRLTNLAALELSDSFEQAEAE